MSTPTSFIAGGDKVSPPISWNGALLGGDTNRVALQWAYERIPYLIDLGYKHIHGWVLVAIAKRTRLSGGNKAWPSQKTIAREIGLKGRSVAYALDELEFGGVIESEKIPGQNHNQYTIHPETEERQWRPWVTCKPCGTANRAVLQSVQDKPANGAGSNLHGLQDKPARIAAEQEKRTGEIEQEKKNKRTTADGQTLDNSPVSQDLGEAKTRATAIALPSGANFTLVKPAPGEASPAASGSGSGTVHLIPVGDAADQVLDAAALLAKQIAEAQEGYATTLRTEMANRLASWFRGIGFPELGEERVCTAVQAALRDSEKCRAFRDWRKQEYFLPSLQRLVDSPTTQVKAGSPAPATTNNRQADVRLDPEVAAQRARMSRMFKPE